MKVSRSPVSIHEKVKGFSLVVRENQLSLLAFALRLCGNYYLALALHLIPYALLYGNYDDDEVHYYLEFLR